MRFTFIDAHRTEFKVTTMCRVLLVSKAGYYAWKDRPASARAVADVQLSLEIAVAHTRSRRTYGSPRIHRDLTDEGHRVGAKRVARLMKDRGLRGVAKRQFRRTTDSNHAHPIAPNVLDRQFAVTTTGAVDRIWASDITYLSTREGWLYLAVVLDLASRRVVGWSMRHTLERGLVLDALGMALVGRAPGAGLLHHSDRGSQYACGDYQDLLIAAGMQCSMSRKGDCWDNAVVESFFSTIKTELAHVADWATREEARAAVFEYIEVWYNLKRRHSSLGYMSPAQYETAQLNAA